MVGAGIDLGRRNQVSIKSLIVAFHHGLELLYVTMEPPLSSGHYGQTATAAPEVMDLAQLEIAMQVAAAGDIAWSWFLPSREADRAERTNDWLMKRFRNAARAIAESDPPVQGRRSPYFRRAGSRERY
jgi:hypothetical protein